MELLRHPAIQEKEETTTLGIRLITLFRGMLAVRDELLEELDSWIAEKASMQARRSSSM